MEQLTVSREIVKQKYLTGNKDERKLLKELFFSDEYQITNGCMCSFCHAHTIIQNDTANWQN